MTRIERIADELERANIAAGWEDRAKKYRERENDPITDGEFCRRRKLEPTMYSRHKSRQSVPTWDSIKKTHAGFDAEGV